MSDPVVVTVSHTLGRAEAVRRLREGFARTKAPFGDLVKIEHAAWEGDTLRFHLRGLGQSATGSIAVMEKELRIEVVLPWLLAKAARHLLPVLRNQTTLLLEKK